MTKKNDHASALAGILRAKRGEEMEAAPVAEIETPVEPPQAAPPSPALPPTPSRVELPRLETASEKRRGGKSSDPSYSQYSVYLRKSIRKKVGRALDDADTGQDFSELVEELLEQWLKSNT